MEPSTNAPSVQTSVATQADDSTATQADDATATQEVVVATQAEAADAKLPTVPPSKVSKTTTDNGGKKSVFWNHFEKIKVEKGVTKAICNYCCRDTTCNDP